MSYAYPSLGNNGPREGKPQQKINWFSRSGVGLQETATIQNSIRVGEAVTVDGVTAEHITKSLGQSQWEAQYPTKSLTTKRDNHKVRMLERGYPIQNR